MPPIKEAPTTPPSLQQLLQDEPDLVDRLFDYLLELLPDLREAGPTLQSARAKLRDEFSGEEGYIRKRDSAHISQKVLEAFNGRNATEVARRLGISRATVYRVLKQAGRSQRGEQAS